MLTQIERFVFFENVEKTRCNDVKRSFYSQILAR